MDEGHRKVEPPLHTAGVTADLPVGRLGQADAVEELDAALLPLLAGDAVHRRLQAQMLAAGQIWIERSFLECGADRLPHLRPFLDDVVPTDRRCACRRRQQRREHVDRRGFAGAVRAEEAEDLARIDMEVDAVDRARAFLELTDEAVSLDAVLARGQPLGGYRCADSRRSTEATAVSATRVSCSSGSRVVTR